MARPSRSKSAEDHIRLLLADQGYQHIKSSNGKICALRRFAFTTALLVGLDDVGYELRYCYEHACDAATALSAWDGHGHPPGPWIKCKGAGIELLNPDLVC